MMMRVAAVFDMVGGVWRFGACRDGVLAHRAFFFFLLLILLAAGFRKEQLSQKELSTWLLKRTKTSSVTVKNMQAKNNGFWGYLMIDLVSPTHAQ